MEIPMVFPCFSHGFSMPLSLARIVRVRHPRGHGDQFGHTGLAVLSGPAIHRGDDMVNLAKHLQHSL